MSIEYTVQTWQEGSQFIAHAMPLDLVTSGRTPEDARGALDEAVNLFVVTATDTGTLEEVLEEAGYQLSAGSWVSATWVAVERHSASVGL